MRSARACLDAAALALAMALVGGCYADADYDPAVVEDAGMYEYEYEPMTYLGNVVYYDIYARPYCFVAGRLWYVPMSYPHYDALVRHYYYNRAAYSYWYAHDAYHGYHDYHGYHGYHGVSGHPSSPAVHAPAGPHGH
jgi:hypothetical protein